MQRRLMRCWRLLPGRGAAGCRGPSLLGVFGQQGTYITAIHKHFTSEAKKEIFGDGRVQWFVAAQSRTKWRKFVGQVQEK